MEENKNKNPFKTPEDYFEGFNDRLLSKLREETDIIPKEDGFTVPDGYFNELNKNIEKQIVSKETKVVQLHPYRKYYMVAASIAAVALVFFSLNWENINTDDPTIEDLSNADIENYFETNNLGLSSYEIAEVLPVDDLEISDILEYTFDEENFVEYLDETIDDFEELNLEDYE